jgi:hypothetical protein
MFQFGKSVFAGLYEALKTDVNVFLVGCAAIASTFRPTKGIAKCILFYVGLRRADDLMGVYVQIKNREMSSTGK